MQPENTLTGSSPDGSGVNESGEKCMPASEGFSIACYENEIPPFIENALERLYGNIFSSLEQFGIYGNTVNEKVMVVLKDVDVISALLFRQEKKKVQVLNEGMIISEEEVTRFVSAIFTALQSANVVSFHAIKPDIRTLPFPYQRFNCTEDIVLALPDTVSTYLNNLGKASRKNIKHHLSRLKRNFPSFRFDIYVKEDVSEQHVRDIIQLNRLRMAGKNKVSAIDGNEAERLIQLVKLRGLVSVAMVDGRVCAGAICFQIGKNYSSHVTAHDPAYDSYRLGTLCCYLTICACIERGGKEFHLLWGRYSYKYMLLGVQRDLDDLVIYRSYSDLLLNGGLALKILSKSCIRRTRFWLEHVLSQDNVMSRLALNLANRVRRRMRF